MLDSYQAHMTISKPILFEQRNRNLSFKWKKGRTKVYQQE